MINISAKERHLKYLRKKSWVFVGAEYKKDFSEISASDRYFFIDEKKRSSRLKLLWHKNKICIKVEKNDDTISN